MSTITSLLSLASDVMEIARIDIGELVMRTVPVGLNPLWVPVAVRNSGVGTLHRGPSRPAAVDGQAP